MTATKTISYSQEAQSIFDEAKTIAVKNNCATIDTECLLLSLMHNIRIRSLITSGCSGSTNNSLVFFNTIRNRVEDSLRFRVKAVAGVVPVFSAGMNIVRASIENEASLNGSFVVSPDHILLGILRHPDFEAGMILTFYGLNYTAAVKLIRSLPDSSKTSETKNVSKSDSVSDSCSTKADSATVHKVPTSDSLKSFFSTIQNKANSAANIVGDVVDRATYRNEWHKALDAALDLSENSGLSVAAAFTHVAMTSPSLMKGISRQQVRKEAIADAIEALLGINSDLR